MVISTAAILFLVLVTIRECWDNCGREREDKKNRMLFHILESLNRKEKKKIKKTQDILGGEYSLKNVRWKQKEELRWKKKSW